MQHFPSKDFKVLYKHALTKPAKQPEVGVLLPFLQACQPWQAVAEGWRVSLERVHVAYPCPIGLRVCVIIPRVESP